MEKTEKGYNKHKSSVSIVTKQREGRLLSVGEDLHLCPVCVWSRDCQANDVFLIYFKVHFLPAGSYLKAWQGSYSK